MMRYSAFHGFNGILLLLFLLHGPFGFAEEEDEPLPFVSMADSPEESATEQTSPLIITEKVVSNLKFYRNKKYIQHIRREEHSRLKKSTRAVTGRYYIIEDVIRDSVRYGRRIDKTVHVELPESALLEEWVARAGPYPRICPLPSFPSSRPSKGDVWKEKTTLALYPRKTDEPIRVPVTIRYRYEGKTIFNEKPVYAVTGFLAFSDGGNNNEEGEAESIEVRSDHTFTILYSVHHNLPIFLKDDVEESFRFSGDEELSYKGFINHWFHYPDYPSSTRQPADRVASDQLRRQGEEPKEDMDAQPADKAEIEDVEYAETEEGPIIRINALRFKPDQAILLSGENHRIARIAELIITKTAGTILVVGHTADVGKPEGQKKLSIERAQTIATKLIENGVDADKILYEGRGGTEPIGDNATESGRACNRRVEIILLQE